MNSFGPSGVSSAVIVKRFLSFVSTTSFICDNVYCRNLGCDNYSYQYSQSANHGENGRCERGVQGRQVGRSRRSAQEDLIYPNDVEEARKVVSTGLRRVTHFCCFCCDDLEQPSLW